MIRSGFIAAVLSLGILPVIGSAQSLSAMDKATSQCFSEVSGSENLNVIIKLYSDRAVLKVNEQPGTSNETVNAYQTCVERKVGAGAAPANAMVPASDSSTPRTAVVPKRVSQQGHRRKDPRCPEYADVLYRGSLYCVGNPS